MNPSRLLSTFFLLTAALSVVLAAYLGYLAFYPFRVLEPRTQPYVLVSKTIPQGGPLLYHIDSCKYTDAPAEVIRTIVGEGTVVSLQSITTNVKPGCADTVSATTRIPETLAPGDYRLELTMCYRVNPLRTICRNARTETFRVIPSKQ